MKKMDDHIVQIFQDAITSLIYKSTAQDTALGFLAAAIAKQSQNPDVVLQEIYISLLSAQKSFAENGSDVLLKKLEETTNTMMKIANPAILQD
ncbi:hypothetical protein HK26_11575 [Acetobacter okinawensis]|uniref:Uncharacterized protein n=1 Tax=Acetobacter okinawensis TaxID=1076594 RepID=A0A252BRC7_9PROT|nr:hypothetical protein HK26_11575 [Acetobacter okinawensis]